MAYTVSNCNGFSVHKAIDAAVERLEPVQTECVAYCCRENTLQFSPEVFAEQSSKHNAENMNPP
jgi:hypothetical protein